MKVFHARDPSRTRSAVTLPRNVQHRVPRVDRAGLLPRGRRYEHEPVVHGRRPGQPRGFVLLDPRLPLLSSSPSIKRVHPSNLVTEDERPSRVILDTEERRADGTVRLVDPVQTSRADVQRVDRATRAADEHRAVENGGRRKCGDVSIEPECPFQCQPAKLCRGQAGGLRCLESGIRRRGAPAVPVLPRRRRHDRPIGCAERARGRRRLRFVRPEKRRHGLSFLAPNRIRDGHHHPKIQRAQDAGGRHLLQRIARRYAGARLVVTRGTIRLVDRFAGGR